MTSRTPLLVSFLLGLAVAAVVLAGALALGAVPQLTGVAPTPTPTLPPMTTPEPLPTDEPTEQPTAEPSAEPTPDPTAEPQPTPGGTYIVQSGDSLSKIGEMFGVPWLLIAEANDIEEPYVIRLGQELVIPVPSAPDPDADDAYYVVQPGDTLDEIAYQLGVSTARLAEINGIENWDEIFVGQRLLIPGREPDESPQPTEEP